MSKLIIISLLCCTLVFMTATAKKYEEDEKPAWAKKDIRDFSDADVERLFDQWEVGSFWCLSSYPRLYEII